MGAGTFAAGGLPTAVGTLLAKRAITSPKGIEIVSKTFAKAGDLVKTASVPEKVKNVFSAGYGASRVGRMVNESSRQSKSGVQEKVQTKSLQSYKPSVPQSASAPYVEPEKIKAKSNVFKSKSSFGKVPRLRVGNFV